MFNQADPTTEQADPAVADAGTTQTGATNGQTTEEGSGIVMDVVNDIMAGNFESPSTQIVVGYAIKAAGALLAIIVAYFVAKLVARWVSTAMCKRVDQTLGKFAGKFTFYTLFLIFGLAILQTAGLSITSFAAILAAAGFAIGLAFQGTLSNFASGILLLVFRPFKVGDVVNAAGVMGKVNEIDLFTTTFDTPDNRRLIVPNSAIASATIENVSHHPERRVDVVVGIGYGASLDASRDALSAAAQAMGDKVVQGEGRGHQIVLGELGASSVDWTVRVWVKSADFWGVKEALTAEVKNQLDTRGLDIPYPQMQIHVAEVEGDTEVGGEEQRNLLQPGAIRPRPRNS